MFTFMLVMVRRKSRHLIPLFVSYALSYIICIFVISAVEFLRNAKQGKYDAVIVDSSDPVGKLMICNREE